MSMAESQGLRRIVTGRWFWLAAILALAVRLSACSGTPDDAPEPDVATPSQTAPTTTPASDQGQDQEGVDTVAGTIVRFTAGSTVVEATIDEDTAATRDFLSMLPMTLEFEDYAGMEKISYLPRGFDTTGNEGMTPEVGDLFSYIPWSNLGFFYDTGSLGHSDQLVRLGATDDLDAVMQLEGQQVTIAVAD